LSRALVALAHVVPRPARSRGPSLKPEPGKTAP
jgi:hypothetical protein